MKISYEWLKEFVDIPDQPRKLGDRLTSVGMAVDAMESVGTDTVFEFDVTTNRPDCLNHVGMAREASAVYGMPLRQPVPELRETGQAAEDTFSISIADPDLCGRYCARYIESVRIGPSPGWLKHRLEVLGIRSINNVADVTNYVMMELGQPLHAFDADTLHARQIVVRRGELDEKITTIDGVERQLDPSILVIADADRPVAIAGVMGGIETEISERTRNVLLESAYFSAASIRKTARSQGMSTEASYRFERGADIESARRACDRAAGMIQQVAGGRVFRGVIDVYPEKRGPVVLTLRRTRIADLLGAPVAEPIVERILSGLEFRVAATEAGWTIGVPTFRVDVGREEDLIEEIARHYGYDQFPATLPPWSGAGAFLPFEREERLLRQLLSACGYSETYGLSFSRVDAEAAFRPDIPPVRLQNPMSEDWTILRTSLISSILKSLEWNINHGNRDVQLYELGKVYHDGVENRALILCGTGALRRKSVHEMETDFRFYDLKGHVETILESFDLHALAGYDGMPGYYHPGRSMRYGDVALLGELHPDIVDSLKLRQRVYLAEIAVETVLRSRTLRQIESLPRYPSVRRDLSLVLDRQIMYADVRAAIEAARIPELIRIEPFDRLDKGPFAESKYSLAISLVYQSPERTLTDDEVDQFNRKILESLGQRLGAELRK
jgi:phenylalanyl-tRNA synthetase beta chain